MAEAPKVAAGTPSLPPAKLPDDFVANEPAAASGVDDSGKPDGTLSPKQLTRAAAEALHALRPQPAASEVTAVLERLAEVDDKGHTKVRVKTAREAADKAVAALNELRK